MNEQGQKFVDVEISWSKAKTGFLEVSYDPAGTLISVEDENVSIIDTLN